MHNELDRLDRRLLSLLQKDARTSAAKLGEAAYAQAAQGAPGAEPAGATAGAAASAGDTVDADFEVVEDDK